MSKLPNYVKLLSFPPVGKLAIKYIKNHGMDFLHISNKDVSLKQEKMLSLKLERLGWSLIGKKLGVDKSQQLAELPLTRYEFYEPFFTDSAKNMLMYPPSEYEKTRTSGSSGKPKWFMHPRIMFRNSYRQTGLATLVILLHDGDKCKLEYGDTVFINVAPPPFPAGLILLPAEELGIVRLVPNINLQYKDKVRFFISNFKDIDAAVILSSSLLTQVMPEINRRIELKGLLTLDSVIADANISTIENMVGISPKTVYACTETLACSVPSIQYPLGFIFDWRQGITEFYPKNKGEINQDSLIGLDEVKIGEMYQIVHTSLIGELTRYVLEDVIKCVAKGDDVMGTDQPVFKFHTRAAKTISLQNFTRISEDEIISGLRRTNISFIDFTTKVVAHNGLEYLVMFLEHISDMTPNDIAKALHTSLYEEDQDYKNLVDFFEYFPIKIRTVPGGTFANFLETIPAGSVPKVDRIEMTNDFDRLLKIIEERGGWICSTM